MEEKIQEKINSKEWKFHELLKLKDASKALAEELYHELKPSEQIQMIWDSKINDNSTFGSLFKKLVMEKLENKVMAAFQHKFESATVNFTGEKISNIQPDLVEQPKSFSEVKEEPTDPMQDLVEGKDVLNPELPLKEIDGMVETSAGKVKVKRV